jgi:uncharacterized protein YraI
MKTIITFSIVALGLLFASNAEAASGLATATINLRTGPGTQYQSMGRIPNGVVIGVAGCTNGYGWCRVNYRGLDGWASSRYIAVQTGGGYTTNDNFGPSAAAIGIPLIAGLVIGSAINNNNRWDDGPGWGWGRRPYNTGWGPGWGPGPVRPGPGWRGPGQWGQPRPHWGDRPGWRDHPGYHPNFYGPGDRWRPRGRW